MNKIVRNFFHAGLPIVCVFLILMTPVFGKEPKIKSPDVIEGSIKVDAEAVIETANALPDLIIIDSRIISDRGKGYIEGSVSLPDEMTTCDSLADVIPSKTRPVLFYCNGPKCGRSAVAVKIALKCDYSNIYWFRGGFEEWQEKKYPYVKK